MMGAYRTGAVVVDTPASIALCAACGTRAELRPGQHDFQCARCQRPQVTERAAGSWPSQIAYLGHEAGPHSYRELDAFASSIGVAPPKRVAAHGELRRRRASARAP